MRKLALLFILAAMIAAPRLPFGPSSATPPVAPARPILLQESNPAVPSTQWSRRALVRLMLEETNRLRRQHRLVPLAYLPVLDVSADAHAADLIAREYFAHESPEGHGPMDRLKQRTPQLLVRGLAENLWMLQTNAPDQMEGTVREAYQGWMNSPGHRENLLKPQWRQSGIGVGLRFRDGQQQIVFVQLFSDSLLEIRQRQPFEWQVEPFGRFQYFAIPEGALGGDRLTQPPIALPSADGRTIRFPRLAPGRYQFAIQPDGESGFYPLLPFESR